MLLARQKPLWKIGQHEARPVETGADLSIRHKQRRYRPNEIGDDYTLGRAGAMIPRRIECNSHATPDFCNSPDTFDKGIGHAKRIAQLRTFHFKPPIAPQLYNDTRGRPLSRAKTFARKQGAEASA